MRAAVGLSIFVAVFDAAFGAFLFRVGLDTLGYYMLGVGVLMGANCWYLLTREG